MAESSTRYRKYSPEEQERMLQSVKESIEAEQKLKQEQGSYLASNPGAEPTVEERRLMSLCGVKTVEDLNLVMSSPLNEEWLKSQRPEDQQALEDWYQKLNQEKDE